MRKKIIIPGLLMMLSLVSCSQDKHIIWSIGIADHSSADLALGPDSFKQFLASDFGFEDKYYLAGFSEAVKSFPYVIPGPVDTWGGTWSTSGWRTHQINIFFGVKKIPEPISKGEWKLVINLLDFAKKFSPLLKVSINDTDRKLQLVANEYQLDKQPHPRLNEPVTDTASITGDLSSATPRMIEIPINPGIIKSGGNCITLAVLEGSWIMFDEVHLEGPAGVTLVSPEKVFIKEVVPAPYEIIREGEKVQPLLVSAEHLKGIPVISVELDGKVIFKETMESGHYQYEVPMPSVDSQVKSRYRIIADGKLLQKGTITRSKQKLQTPADYVDTRIGTAHSRWMIAPGPWMPFSMVKLSPDNQNSGWQAGYEPSFESIGTFSHIHEWTLGGLGIFASNGKLITRIGDELLPEEGYRSAINKRTEEAPIGYYKAELTDYNIKAEITSTTRCGFMRFTFPENRDSARILIDLKVPAENRYEIKEIRIKQINKYRIEGSCHQLAPRVWSIDAHQDYTVYFVLEFDKPFESMGSWLNDTVNHDDSLVAEEAKQAGVFLQFNARQNPVVQVRSGISYVSVANAALNLETEITDPFGWSFDAVRENHVKVWNDLFNRVLITTDNRLEKIRFYTNFYRAVCSRNIFSDVNGEWVSTDKKIRKIENPDNVALGCDAFWNTFWNLNQFWNLVTPEWSGRWVNSQLAMFDANGWLAKGPGGMNYIPVMVAEHEIPLIVGAYQMGIRNFDPEKALKAAIKMQTTPAQKVFNGFAGNRNLVPYLKYKYVPSDMGRFSNSMEYSFDDWTVGQMAKAMGKTREYQLFNERGYWWRNAINPENGYCHMRLSDGSWVSDFDPFRSGANRHYVEANAWQMTFFVPQDVPALADLIGKERFLERLEWGFNQSEKWRYNAPNDQYWDYPVVQGNQQSMHFSFLFNWVQKPWLTQKWTRSIIDRYYGAGISNAYLGDEDQGQMSAWLLMASIGLFQTDGGCRIDPVYEIASPLYEKIEIDLGKQFGRGEKFVIEARKSSRKNIYVQKAVLNGKELNSFYFPASELLKGGSLILEMGPEPNVSWGIDNSFKKGVY
ncbi:MAG TPA: hypothetical protein DDW27_16240 [Bacteroidales bacterium]|nr:hypothetical protein [Bacteroidales bacterium]